MLLEDINMFIVLAEMKNYTVAADMLYISQSSLTKRIQKLERSMGVKLFTRTTKSVELSPYGQVYYKYAKQIQTASEACTREIQDMISHGNSLIIGCIPSILDYNISLLIFRYMSSSGIQCQIKTEESECLEKNLLEGHYDFAFIRDVDTTLPLTSVPFAEDHMMVVLPKGHPMSHREHIYIKELRDEPFLLHPRGSRPYRNVLSLCRKEKFEPNVVYTDPHMRNICSMVASGMGISLLNEHLISKNVTGICAVPVAPAFTSRITLCYSSESEPSAKQREFLTFYKKEMKKNSEKEMAR